METCQNNDGGFGNSLEQQPLQPLKLLVHFKYVKKLITTSAFQICKEIDVNPDHPLHRKAIQYLLNTFDEVEKVWDIIPPEVEDAPHALWWTHEANRDCFGKYLINSRLEIVGYLHDYGVDLVSTDWLQTLTSEIMEHLFSLTDDLEMHHLLCCSRLAKTDNLPDVEKLMF